MAVAPAKFDLRVQRRADHPLDVTLKDSAGVAINLTGWSIIAQVWDKTRTTKHGDFTVTVTNAAAGQVRLLLPYTVTTSLPAEARYDVLLISPAGLREFYLEGIVRASEGYSS